MADPKGSELRPRPALTVLWSLCALELLPRRVRWTRLGVCSGISWRTQNFGVTPDPQLWSFERFFSVHTVAPHIFGGYFRYLVGLISVPLARSHHFPRAMMFKPEPCLCWHTWTLSSQQGRRIWSIGSWNSFVGKQLQGPAPNWTDDLRPHSTVMC